MTQIKCVENNFVLQASITSLDHFPFCLEFVMYMRMHYSLYVFLALMHIFLGPPN